MSKLLTFRQFLSHDAAQKHLQRQKTKTNAQSLAPVRTNPTPVRETNGSKQTRKTGNGPPKLLVLKHHSTTADGTHLFQIRGPTGVSVDRVQGVRRPDRGGKEQIVIHPVKHNL